MRDELSTEQALRDSEERLRLVRRATGLGMYEIDWVARRRYWSPELRALLRVPDDLDINTDTDLLERIIPDEMRAAFRDKLQGSLAPESGGDYEDEHRITRFDGSTGWILLRGKTFFAEGPEGRRATRSIGLIVDITDRKRGEEANALHASTVLLVERRDLLDRSRRRSSAPGTGARSGSTATRRRGDRPADHHPLPGRPARRAACALSRRPSRASRWCSKPCAVTRTAGSIPVGISGAPIFDAEHGGRASRRCIAT